MPTFQSSWDAVQAGIVINQSGGFGLFLNSPPYFFGKTIVHVPLEDLTGSFASFSSSAV